MLSAGQIPGISIGRRLTGNWLDIDGKSRFNQGRTNHQEFARMKTLLVLSAFVVIASLATTVNAQSQKDIGSGGVITTTPNDKYGPGGKLETCSDKKYKLLFEKYYDKCGRLREHDFLPNDNEGMGYTDYYDENGKNVVHVSHNGYFKGHSTSDKIDPKEGKALVAKYEKTPSAPCPEKGEQAKEEPQPKGKSPGKTLLESVNIGIGIGGGHTVRRDDHERGRTSTTQKGKTISAGCKCHPCTCSPSCTCH
jgi:hypothetical protein